MAPTAAAETGLAVLQALADMPRTVVFETLATSGYDFVLTYDPAPDIVALIDEYDLAACQATTTTTHHSRAAELIITRRPVFGDS